MIGAWFPPPPPTPSVQWCVRFGVRVLGLGFRVLRLGFGVRFGVEGLALRV